MNNDEFEFNAAVRGEAVAECLLCNDTGDMALGPTDYFGTCSCAAVVRNANSAAFIDAMPKRAAFIEWASKKHLDVTVMKDAWGAQIFANSHVQAMWTGWFSVPTVSARAADAPSEPSGLTTRLDVLSLVHSLMHNAYTAGMEGDEIDTSYMAKIENGLRAMEYRAADALDSQPTDGGVRNG